MFSRFSVLRLSAGSIYKLLLVGLLSSFLPVGLLLGVFALFGADTVKWNNEPLHGVTGLVSGPLVGMAVALFFSAFIGTAATLGLWLYSKFRPLSLSAKGLRQDASSDA